MILRVFWKLLLRYFFNIDSFCKICGKKVYDFDAPDDIWEQVDKTIRFGHTLCYDCFCKRCRHLGLPSIWTLKKLT